MSFEVLFLAAQWVFLSYFIALNCGYISLMIIATFSLRQQIDSQNADALPGIYSGLELPISILVPAYNEAPTIVTSVRALLQLDYPEYEIIVINDGSSDDTIETLKKEFSLLPFPEAYRVRLQTQKIRAMYYSRAYPKVRVIDKENGGKADALNAGINAARYPLFCGVDADSVLEPDSLKLVVEPFLQDGRTVASGGTVRVANGCTVSDGFMEKIEMPTNFLAMFQVIEYLRAFLFGRLGWSPLNSVLVISGAFGLFHKETVLHVGGYKTDTIGEDMELVVRMHRVLREEGRAYRITFLAEPICWTEVPESLNILKSQRKRWQRGLAESLSLNIGLLCSRKGGWVGWLAMPFMFFFELLGPLLEVSGYIFMIIGFSLGWISSTAFIAFLFVAVGLGIMLSVCAMLLEEMSFHVYPRVRHTVYLFLVSIAENFGYRQLMSFYRLIGLWLWLTGKKGGWGEMKRTAKWSETPNVQAVNGAGTSDGEL